ncbi:MAG: pantoate--beta-alanine ligase [Candidatus Krumholzibacteriota bacterium]|nr:pantoate--beta-alanine ligase [Candidatus Krumholzibacteriota bacterium]
MQAFSRRVRAAGERVGLVPTMGNLHEGHLSLLRLARARCERVVASIFVNPTQFGPDEDYAAYPRTLAADLAALAAVGCDVAFVPEARELYPRGGGGGDDVTVKLAWGQDRLCAARRPGHFDGVLTVVARLFNAVLPDAAWFGQKDAQQALMVRRMTEALRFPVEVRLGPTVREPDGLALSSRNAYLSPTERREATALSRALAAAGAALRSGERDPERLAAAGREVLAAAAGLTTEYFAVVDPETLAPPAAVGDGLLLMAGAARLGRARLIDNQVHRVAGEAVHDALLF